MGWPLTALAALVTYGAIKAVLRATAPADDGAAPAGDDAEHAVAGPSGDIDARSNSAIDADGSSGL